MHRYTVGAHNINVPSTDHSQYFQTRSVAMKIKQLLTSKRGGSLLKGNLSPSDDFHSRSESSSSISKKQRKKSYFPSKLLFRKNSTAGNDGYESESEASTNSTRSTSSSFLRYQNKFLKLKSVFERRGDGSEVPVQSKSKLPAIFDGIYKRQNTIDDNYASDSDESKVDTSAPSEIICEEIICSDLIDPTIELSSSKVQYPTQQLTQTLPLSTVATEQHIQRIDAKPSRSQRKKKQKSKTARLLAPVPISIPRTISYSLRSAISDGSKRERNSHSLMERRAFRVNGSHIDTSYWSHRGKRAYMEGAYLQHLIVNFFVSCCMRLTYNSCIRYSTFRSICDRIHGCYKQRPQTSKTHHITWSL